MAEVGGLAEAGKKWQGKTVGEKFPLQRYLGGSGHSAVFLTQSGNGKAAIKLLFAPPDDAEAQLSRWRLASRLSHPHLLQIFEAGRAALDGTQLLYVVMEYADEDLSQIIPQRALSAEESREMLRPALEALAYLHKEGCTHGHIKPSNVMAVGEQVKLSSDTISASRETAQVERSIHDAPETASGVISPAADVWSLGVTLVEAMTQRLPDPTHAGAAVLPPGMAETFQEIARGCLQADPRQRWTVAQVASRLEPGPTTATLRPATTRSETPAKWLYLAPLGVAAVIGVILVSGSKTKKSSPAEQNAETPPAAVTPVPPAVQQAKPARTPQPKPNPATTAPSPSRGAANSSTPQTQGPANNPAGGTSSNPAPTGNGVPGVAHSVLPAVSPRARATIQGKVRVRVRVDVDTSGNVTAASFESEGPSKYFSRLAMEAAKEWKFAPAESGGRLVPSRWLIRFAFGRHETEVYPKRISP